MRQKLIDTAALEKEISKDRNCDLKTYTYIKFIMEKVPAADAEFVRYAHWIDLSPELTGIEHEYECSECAARSVIHPYLLENARYCHFCGAKMEGE